MARSASSDDDDNSPDEAAEDDDEDKQVIPYLCIFVFSFVFLRFRFMYRIFYVFICDSFCALRFDVFICYLFGFLLVCCILMFSFALGISLLALCVGPLKCGFHVVLWID